MKLLHVFIAVFLVLVTLCGTAAAWSEPASEEPLATLDFVAPGEVGDDRFIPDVIAPLTTSLDYISVAGADLPLLLGRFPYPPHSPPD